METSLLDARCLLRVSGPDAESFLQNLLTQNVAGLAEGRLVYGCLLTAQGRFLHDMFVFREGGDFVLDIARERKDDLLKRFAVFKLRAKVSFAEDPRRVYAGAAGTYPDPRLAALGFRTYTEEALPAAPGYDDRRIHLGVPEGGEMKPDIDYLTDANLDRLNAVAWDKGCFVGQEVSARVHNKGQVKRRLLIVSGAGLQPGGALMQEGRAVGEVRSVNSAGTEGLAVVKTDAAPEGVAMRRPDWL